MKAAEQYFPVVLFIVLYNVILTFNDTNGIVYYERFSSSSGKN